MSAPAHLLVVDDVADNRAILGRRLVRAGFAVSEAGDGETALAMVARDSYDLVLLDWMMPGLSGIEVLQRLRAGERGARLPVIIVTARDASKDLVDALQAGANDYVTKPIDFPVVLARLRTQLARKQAEDALHSLNAELEERVAARTASLVEANARLAAEAEARQQAAEGLRQALATAESANRSKSAFLSAISHELRTPLNAIIGFSEIIREEVAGPIGQPAYRDYASDIHTSGLLLLGIVDNILTISRAEAQATLERATAVDVAALVRRCAEDAAGAAEVRQVSLAWTVSDTLPAVLGDEAALAQALRALVSNAVKFNRPGGHAAVEASRTAGGGLRIEVKDTGPGIAADDVPLVLRPFTQLDDSLTRRHDGLGLGLPVAKLIAEAHDGRLELASAPGVGTTVAIVLPAERLQQREPRSVRALPEAASA